MAISVAPQRDYGNYTLQQLDTWPSTEQTMSQKDTTTHCINNSHRWLKQRVQTMVDLITDPELVVMTEKGDFWPSTCWVKNSEFIS